MSRYTTSLCSPSLYPSPATYPPYKVLFSTPAPRPQGPSPYIRALFQPHSFETTPSSLPKSRFLRRTSPFTPQSHHLNSKRLPITTSLSHPLSLPRSNPQTKRTEAHILTLLTKEAVKGLVKEPTQKEDKSPHKRP